MDLVSKPPATLLANHRSNYDNNLNYKEPELMKNNTYNQAYTKEQAHKTKKRKMRTNYVSASEDLGAF